MLELFRKRTTYARVLAAVLLCTFLTPLFTPILTDVHANPQAPVVYDAHRDYATDAANRVHGKYGWAETCEYILNKGGETRAQRVGYLLGHLFPVIPFWKTVTPALNKLRLIFGSTTADPKNTNTDRIQFLFRQAFYGLFSNPISTLFGRGLFNLVVLSLGRTGEMISIYKHNFFRDTMQSFLGYNLTNLGRDAITTDSTLPFDVRFKLTVICSWIVYIGTTVIPDILRSIEALHHATTPEAINMAVQQQNVAVATLIFSLAWPYFSRFVNLRVLTHLIHGYPQAEALERFSRPRPTAASVVSAADADFNRHAAQAVRLTADMSRRAELIAELSRLSPNNTTSAEPHAEVGDMGARAADLLRTDPSLQSDAAATADRNAPSQAVQALIAQFAEASSPITPATPTTPANPAAETLPGGSPTLEQLYVLQERDRLALVAARQGIARAEAILRQPDNTPPDPRAAMIEAERAKLTAAEAKLEEFQGLLTAAEADYRQNRTPLSRQNRDLFRRVISDLNSKIRASLSMIRSWEELAEGLSPDQPVPLARKLKVQRHALAQTFAVSIGMTSLYMMLRYFLNGPTSNRTLINLNETTGVAQVLHFPLLRLVIRIRGLIENLTYHASSTTIDAQVDELMASVRTLWTHVAQVGFSNLGQMRFTSDFAAVQQLLQHGPDHPQVAAALHSMGQTLGVVGNL